MTRLLYDSTNIVDDPAAAHMVAHYIDGRYAVSAASVRARFPSAILVPISAIGTDAGIVGDVEPGCIALADCVRWVQLRRLANADPTLYVNELNDWAPARAQFHAAGVPEPHWWVADYDGLPVIPSGAVAKQYANPTLTHGHFDLSIVADYWPGVDGQTGDDMTSREHDLLVAIAGALIGVSEDEGKSVKNSLDAILAAVTKPEPAETEPAAASAITPQVAADLATIAGFLRKFGQ